MGGCAQPSPAASVVCEVICAVGAVLAVSVAAFAFTVFGVRRASDQARPSQLYLTPDPLPPRSLLIISPK